MQKTTHIKKHDVELPFKETIPVIDVFDLPEILNRKKIPPQYLTFTESTYVVATEEAFQDMAERKVA